MNSRATPDFQPARSRGHTAFTLIELLVTISVALILAGIVIAMLPSARLAARRTQSLSNLRQLGIALNGFANDNRYLLPGRVRSTDKWPRLLLPYLDNNPRVYGEPDDIKCFLRTGADPLTNGRNNTSYILNGFNDVGAFDNETIQVSLLNVQKPTQTILMACQSGTGNFYMDFMEGNQNTVLNRNAYGSGSNYLFADGSARFVTSREYDDRLWLVDKSSAIPQS
jgi:prepilin-type N-terminal cleavage/methylation domain-containing protein/prepilin-type processing-associated H-X9-DG protein